jgi:hypothetical protein
VGDNAGVSNPYAPPEDRPRTPEGAPAEGDGRVPGSPAPAPGPPASAPGTFPPPGAPAPLPDPVQPVPGPGAPGGAGPRGAGAQGQPGAPDPAAAGRVGRLAGTFGLLVVASVLVATLALPWRAASIVFAALAVVWGVRALTTAVRSGFRGGLPAMLVLGVLVAGGWVLLSLASLVVWDAERANQDCVARAITVQARQECAHQLQHDIDQRTRDWRDRLEQP